MIPILYVNYSLHQLFERRMKVIHDGHEQQKYSALSLEFMSEESSSDEDGTSIVVHKPEWRSDSKWYRGMY